MQQCSHTHDMPGTIGHSIHHDHGDNFASWFAALTGLDRDYVAQKLAEAVARIAAGVSP